MRRRPAFAVVICLIAIAASAMAGATRPAPVVVRANKVDISPAFRTLAALPTKPAIREDENQAAGERDNLPLPWADTPMNSRVVDGARQATAPVRQMPAPLLTFQTLNNIDNYNTVGGRVLPPDTNGDVGGTYFVQTVNLVLAVYDKTTGAKLFGPVKTSSLWTGFGGLCETRNDGDPIVLYDEAADRWMISQFTSNTTTPPTHQCIAISQTGDPTGAYYRFDFTMPNSKFNDYPHFGVWNDAYYMTDHQFTSVYAGEGVFAYDRALMLAGNAAASYIYFDLNSTFPEIGGMLPADSDGTLPPAGEPGYFVYPIATDWGYTVNGLRIFEFHADFTTPANSTFTERAESPVVVAAFSPLNPAGRNDILQPAPAGAAQGLDSISDRLMHRLQYRNFGDHENLVVAHTVDVDPSSVYQAGVRYYALRRDFASGGFTVAEQASYAPDSTNRWMASAAMDSAGNIAVGFSASSSSVYPSIRFAGRFADDPPNGLFQGERDIATGAGVQMHTSGRWGDYSSLSVDPTDGCTFYYTNEYYTATNEMCGATASSACWKTAVGSFRFPNCGSQPAGTLSGTVTNAATLAPINGAVVSTTAGYSKVTSGGGAYSLTLSPGTIDATASAYGYTPSTSTGLSIVASQTTNADFALTPVPIIQYASNLVDDTNGNGNGVVDRNECFKLGLTLHNDGMADATNVAATVSSSTPGVTVFQNATTFPTITAGGNASSIAPFSIETSPSFICGTQIVINVSVTSDQGPVSLSFNVPTGTLGTATTFSATGPVPIPDNNSAGAFLAIPVSAMPTGSAVGKVTISLYLTHTWDGDITLSLIAPDGTTTSVLAANRGGSGDNYGTDCPAGANDTTFDDAASNSISSGASPFVGSFRPESALSVFNALTDPNGTWKLKVVDGFAGDTGNIECATISIQQYQCTDGGGACNIAVTPTAITVDAAAGGVSNMNGVLEPGESVIVAPTWRNSGTETVALTGAASNAAGPAGATYTIDDGVGDYGTLAGGNSGPATDTYTISVSNPALRPSTHWDMTFDETPTTVPAGSSSMKTWTLHIGNSFTDVPQSMLFYDKMEAMLHYGVTLGCTATDYCPLSNVLRSAMAAFVARAMAGGDANVPVSGTVGANPYSCTNGGTSLFADVPATDTFCRHIHYIAAQSVTLGCDATHFCPSSNVRRDQMAAFIARAVAGGDASVPVTYSDPITLRSYDLPNNSFHFTDMGTTGFSKYAHYIWAKGIIDGCTATEYCPTGNVTRQQMSKFIANAFSLVLYHP